MPAAERRFPFERMGKLLGPALRVLAVFFGVLPWVVALVPLPGALDPLRASLAEGFALQCHQRTTRGIELFGALFPVCARCLGIYAGLGLGAAFGRPRLTERALATWLGAATVFMLADVASELSGLRTSESLLRALTGLLLAYPVGIAVTRLQAEHEAQ